MWSRETPAGRTRNVFGPTHRVPCPHLSMTTSAPFSAAVPIELIEPDTARLLFETNTLGRLAMLQAILPRFRERRSGTIINVTSTVTLKPLPLVSVSRATKAAVNALTESLAVGMAPVRRARPHRRSGSLSRDELGNNAMPHLRGVGRHLTQRQAPFCVPDAPTLSRAAGPR